MPTMKAVTSCDDEHGRHVWPDDFDDDDTCQCGRFHLDLHPMRGLGAELTENLPEADD